jgi:hypothetical protein
MSDEYFRRTVLSGLDVLCEMLVCEAGVAQICNFEEEFIIKFDAHTFPL